MPPLEENVFLSPKNKEAAVAIRSSKNTILNIRSIGTLLMASEGGISVSGRLDHRTAESTPSTMRTILMILCMIL
jgi:hypothetical protein